MIYNNPLVGYSLLRDYDLFTPLCYEVSPMVSEDYKEYSDKLEYQINLPNVKKKNIKLTFGNGLLNIEAKQTETDNNWFGRRTNYYHSSFSKSISINDDLDIDKVKAKFKNGNLKITIPKKNTPENYRQIPVYGDDHIIDAMVIDDHEKESVVKKLWRGITGIFNKEIK